MVFFSLPKSDRMFMLRVLHPILICFFHSFRCLTVSSRISLGAALISTFVNLLFLPGNPKKIVSCTLEADEIFCDLSKEKLVGCKQVWEFLRGCFYALINLSKLV